MAVAPSPFRSAIERLQPGANRQHMIELFGDRTTWNTIRDWWRGKRHAPTWALDLLEEKDRQRSAAIQSDIAKARQARNALPGRQAGAKNLAEYLARR